MSAHAFDGVSIDEKREDTLIVHGDSEVNFSSGKLRVAVIAKKNDDKRSETTTDGFPQGRWTVEAPSAGFADGEEVVVVGMASVPNQPDFLWGNALTVEAKPTLPGPPAAERSPGA